MKLSAKICVSKTVVWKLCRVMSEKLVCNCHFWLASNHDPLDCNISIMNDCVCLSVYMWSILILYSLESTYILASSGKDKPSSTSYINDEICNKRHQMFHWVDIMQRWGKSCILQNFVWTNSISLIAIKSNCI